MTSPYFSAMTRRLIFIVGVSSPPSIVKSFVGLVSVQDVDRLPDQRKGLRVLHELVVIVKRQTRGARPALELLEVRDDEGREELLAVADEHGGRDVPHGLQRGFDRRRRDVLAVRIDQNLLLAVRE